jgi:hypothetical protein
MTFPKPREDEIGYGDKDRELAGALRSASSREEAERIARADSMDSLEDALAWLRERSPEPGSPRARAAR